MLPPLISLTQPQHRGWIYVFGITLGGFLWGSLAYGLLNGLGVLAAASAMILSLSLLKFTIGKLFQGKQAPRGATSVVIFAWLFKLPATLGLLTISIWLCGLHITPMATVIVLVYFAVVIGVFFNGRADHPQKK